MSIGMLPPNIREEGLPPVNRPPVVTPTVDPNFVSGFNYARSIAGGLPMEQVIAPGVSFSPDQPSGFTQMDLNEPVTTTATPPVQQDIIMDDTSPDYSQLPPNIIGGGRGDNITILQDQMRFPPPRDILGGFNFIPQIDVDVLREGLRNEITSLIPTIETPDVSNFVTRKDIDQAIQNIDIPTMSMMPDLTPFDQRLASLEQGLFDLQQGPTGGRFSIERQDPMGLFA